MPGYAANPNCKELHIRPSNSYRYPGSLRNSLRPPAVRESPGAAHAAGVSLGLPSRNFDRSCFAQLSGLDHGAVKYWFDFIKRICFGVDTLPTIGTNYQPSAHHLKRYFLDSLLRTIYVGYKVK
jgi:hypothetical protein